MKLMKNIILALNILFLAACGGGGSSSGGPTEPGSNIPAAFVGTYQGTLNLTASALGITQSESFPITITVTADGQLRFDGDEPDETFTVGVTNDGRFNGSLSINEQGCEGTVTIDGAINSAGTNASGSVDGDGSCTIDGVSVDVDLGGDFSANK